MKKIDTKKLDKKLKGWHRHFRGRFLLIKNGVLKEEEYVLWDVSFSLLADWDSSESHVDIRGSFPHNFAEISYYLNCDPSSVSRRSKKLFELGLWRKRDDGRIEVCGYSIVDHLTEITKKSQTVNLQDYIANPHFTNAFLNSPDVKTHDSSAKGFSPQPPQSDAYLHDQQSKDPLVSFKGESNVSLVKMVNIKGKVRTDEEYEKIYEENGNQGLSIEDMKFIDETLVERRVVDELNEADIVNTFFEGNWEEYKKNIYFAKKND